MTSSKAITNLYYTYIAVLPLLAFLSIYWVPENWDLVLGYIDSGGESDGVYLYNVFCFIAIFVSGLLGVLFVRLIPIPKSAIAGLFMLFDAPKYQHTYNDDKKSFFVVFSLKVKVVMFLLDDTLRV